MEVSSGLAVATAGSKGGGGGAEPCRADGSGWGAALRRGRPAVGTAAVQKTSPRQSHWTDLAALYWASQVIGASRLKITKLVALELIPLWLLLKT